VARSALLNMIFFSMFELIKKRINSLEKKESNPTALPAARR